MSVFRPGATTPSETLTGLNQPTALAFDRYGDLFVANFGNGTVSMFAPPAGGVVVRSSLSNRPMSLGGTNSAVAGVNLTDAELAQVQTLSHGAVTFGDSNQSGDISIATATLATTAGATTNVLQSSTSASKIVLDDGSGTGTALNGNGGNVNLTAGIGGIIAASANNAKPEIATTGSAVTLNTTGAIGTPTNRIQFADNMSSTQQKVTIGTTQQPESVYIDGLGSLTLGSFTGSGTNSALDVTARKDLVVATYVTLSSGAGTLSLGADVKADGTGDDGVGTLSIGANASVTSSNPATNAITLRGADVDLAAGNTVVGGRAPKLSTTPTAMYGSADFFAGRIAIDNSDNLYVVNRDGSGVWKFASGSLTPTAFLGGLQGVLQGLACDSSGNLFVADGVQNVILKYTPGSVSPTIALTGFAKPSFLLFDHSGNLYVSDAKLGTVSEFPPGSTTPAFTATVPGASRMAMDASGTLYVEQTVTLSSGDYAYSVVRFAPGSTVPTATLSTSGIVIDLAVDANGTLYVTTDNTTGGPIEVFPPGATSPSATFSGPYSGFLAFDAVGTLYASNPGRDTVSVYPQGTTSPAATLTGSSSPGDMAFDSTGNLYLANYDGTPDFPDSEMITKYSPVTPPPEAGGIIIRSSLSGRPMSLGGANNAVAGINLTDAELAKIATLTAGTITFGDTNQTGDITFATAMPATTSGAATVVMQSPTGGGKIILDDGAGAGTALDGHGGNVTLSPGIGGIMHLKSAAGSALSSNGFNATGLPLNLSLGFAPSNGTQLTIINNTATPNVPISGTFAGLPQGGLVTLNYLGTPYTFQANYTGGDGNDLVLTAGQVWVNTTSGATNYTPGTSASLVDPAVTVTDVNGVSSLSATVSITAGLQAGDTLTFTNQNGISGNYAAGVLTLTGNATVANYQAALRTIGFASASGNLGNRTISFAVTDGAVTSPTTTKQINVIAAAAVTGVYVTSPAWSNGAYLIPAGGNQTQTLPWTNINQIAVQFNEAVTVQQSDLVVNGEAIGTYSFSNFSYDTNSLRAVWTVSQNLGTDKLTLHLDGHSTTAVRNAAGDLLDGEWTDQTSNYPSGDGVVGGDLSFNFNVLPADVNRDGIVNGLDITLIASNWLHSGSLGDTNCDNIVNGLDIAAIASHWLQSLPAGGAASSAAGAIVADGGDAGAVLANGSTSEQGMSVASVISSPAVQPADDERPRAQIGTDDVASPARVVLQQPVDGRAFLTLSSATGAALLSQGDSTSAEWASLLGRRLLTVPTTAREALFAGHGATRKNDFPHAPPHQQIKRLEVDALFADDVDDLAISLRAKRVGDDPDPLY